MGQLETVPDSTVLPRCEVLARVAELKKLTSQSGKLMYRGEFRINEDGENRFTNMPIFEQYVIGSDADPGADDIKTWQSAPGARNLKRLFKKLNLEIAKEVDDLIVEAEDQEIGLSVQYNVEPPTKKKKQADGTIKEEPNPYAGIPRNRISNYWTPGEKSPQIYPEEGDGGEAAAPTAAAPKAAPKVAAPAGKPAAKPAAPKATAPAAVVEEEEAVGGGEAVEEAPTPVAAPAPKATAPKPNGAAGAAKVVSGKTAAAPKEKELECPECHVQVVKSQFGDHIATEHPDA